MLGTMFTKTSAAHQVAYLVFDDNADIGQHVCTAAYRSDLGPKCYAGYMLDDGTRVGIDDRDFNGLAHVSVTVSNPGAPAWYHAVLPAYDTATRAAAARVLTEMAHAALDTGTDDIEFDDDEYDDAEYNYDQE